MRSWDDSGKHRADSLQRVSIEVPTIASAAPRHCDFPISFRGRRASRDAPHETQFPSGHKANCVTLYGPLAAGSPQYTAMKYFFKLAAPLLILALGFPIIGSTQTSDESHHHSDTATGTPPEQLGRVSFANSCTPAVQASFERAVALLHSVWWQEGERTFREVLRRDPKCAIATWGIAAILIGNPFAAGPTPAQAQQAEAAIARGRAIGAKTERERFYIEAVAQYYEGVPGRAHGASLLSLSGAFARLAARFTEDDEA